MNQQNQKFTSEPRKIKTLNNGQVDRLLEQLAKGPDTGRRKLLTYRDYCMTLFMVDAGLRVGELVRLRQGDIYYAGECVEQLTVRAEIAKGKHERTIPMSPRLTSACQWMHKKVWPQTTDAPKHYAFYNWEPHQYITERQVERIIKGAGCAIGASWLTPHVLRHTFATRVLKKSNIRVAQQLLGHKSITSTQIYTHPDQDDRTNAIRAISEENLTKNSQQT